MSASPELAPPGSAEALSLRVVSHTGLVYWWPVWLVGFLLAGLTYLDGDRMAAVPAGTEVKALGGNTYQLTVPNRPSPALEQASKATAAGEPAFTVRVSGNRNYGMLYVVVLLIVIFGSNSPLRGIGSLVAMLLVFLLVLVLASFDAWGWILDHLWGLHIEISLAGYLVPSVVLLVLWLVVVFCIDPLRFVHFTPGQLTVRQDIGDASKVYGATGITVQKRSIDLFRHWILGFGAGDLVIRIPNGGPEIVLTNVLFVDQRAQQIADLLRTRTVTAG